MNGNIITPPWETADRGYAKCFVGGCKRSTSVMTRDEAEEWLDHHLALHSEPDLTVTVTFQVPATEGDRIERRIRHLMYGQLPSRKLRESVEVKVHWRSVTA